MAVLHLEGQFDRSMYNTPGVGWGMGAEDQCGVEAGEERAATHADQLRPSLIAFSRLWVVVNHFGDLSPKSRILEPGETPMLCADFRKHSQCEKTASLIE